MSRSKHTDPKTIRAVRRLRAPREGRGADDLRRRRELGLALPPGSAIAGKARRGPSRLRIIVRPPRHGFHHPANKQDVLGTLEAVGPIALYGLRSVELNRAPANRPALGPVFARYCVPGRIILFEQPVPPWRLPGLLKSDIAHRFERAGAILTLLPQVGATLVDWPGGTLRRFILEHVLLHELGHHVLQHHKGKQPVRIARTRDHEAFAARFAERQRARLKKGSRL